MILDRQLHLILLLIQLIAIHQFRIFEAQVVQSLMFRFG